MNSQERGAESERDDTSPPAAAARTEAEAEALAEAARQQDRRPRRRGGLVGRLFGNARRSARTLLTPQPEDPVEPVPPVLDEEVRLLTHSPFSIGFFGAIGVLVALWLASAVGQVSGILVLVVVALFLALGLNPAVEFFSRRRVPRGLAVGIISVLGLGVIALGLTALVPMLIAQVQNLAVQLPAMLQNMTSNRQFDELNQRFQIIDRVREVLNDPNLAQNVFGGLSAAGQALANTLFSTIILVVLTVFFLASLPSIKEVIYKMAPASRRARTRYLADEIFRGVSGYINGMFIIVALAGTAAFIFLNIIGLNEFALALAFVVALFSFIPVVGPMVAMVLVTLIALAQSSTAGIASLIYFLVYQQFEAYVLYPNVMRRTVQVPGVLVVLSAILGGMLLGVLGALIAIPTTAALLLLHREVLQPYLDAH